MPLRKSLVVSTLFLACLPAVAKDKKKFLLPTDVLQAHTAWVIVDPHAGMDVQDPNADRQACADVERALAKWGRLTPVTDPSQADLIIVIHKSNGKLVQDTIGRSPMNTPPPVIAQRTDTGITAAGRTGPPLETPDPHPQMEVGTPDDTFAVYRGNPANSNSVTSGNPLDAPPVWRYTARDALVSPSVPAVDKFRRLIEEAEKQQAGTP